MTLEANRYRFHKATSSCMATLDSRTSNHGFTTIKRYVRKSSSVTLNEALFGRQPVSLCFYSFLRDNKESWHHPMMINLWLINLSLIFLFRTTILFIIRFIFSHALHFVINVVFISLHIHVLHIVGLVVL